MTGSVKYVFLQTYDWHDWMNEPDPWMKLVRCCPLGPIQLAPSRSHQRYRYAHFSETTSKKDEAKVTSAVRHPLAWSILLTGERPATSETDTPCIGFICSAAMVCFLSSLCLAAFEVTMIVTQRSPTTAINGPLAYDRESRGRRPHFYTSATAKHTPIYFEVLICARHWASLDAAYYLSALALGGLRDWPA